MKFKTLSAISLFFYQFVHTVSSNQIQEDVLPTQKENGPDIKKTNQPAIVLGDDTECEKSWHPDYGYMKDTFWKDLELGRITNILHEGDMYSKVKGSRRAAHAEAMANIQKQQQNPSQNKTNASINIKKATPPKSFPKTSIRQSIQKSPPVKSPCLSPNKTSNNAVKNKSIQKRNPFGARGYMSAKRSRRSKASMVTTKSKISRPSAEASKQSTSSIDQSKVNTLEDHDISDGQCLKQMDGSPKLDLSVAASVDNLTSAASLSDGKFICDLSMFVESCNLLIK